MARHWVYHPKEDAKIVETEEQQKLLKSGWFDSPAKIPRETEIKEKEIEDGIEEVKKEVKKDKK